MSSQQSIFERLSKAETKSSANKKKVTSSCSISSNSSTSLAGGKPTISNRTPGSSVFDRLSKTDTYSSATMKDKSDKKQSSSTVERKTTRSFFDRMSKTDTYSSAKMKERPSTENPSAQNYSAKTIKTTNSFFDRMSKTETYSSAKMKEQRQPTSSSSSTSSKPKTSTQNVSSQKFHHDKNSKENVYDRLSKANTASSAIRYKKTTQDDNATNEIIVARPPRRITCEQEDKIKSSSLIQMQERTLQLSRSLSDESLFSIDADDETTDLNPKLQLSQQSNVVPPKVGRAVAIPEPQAKMEVREPTNLQSNGASRLKITSAKGNDDSRDQTKNIPGDPAQLQQNTTNLQEPQNPDSGMSFENAKSDIKYKLFIREKYNAEAGPQKLNVDDLNLVDTLESFESGLLSNHQLSVKLIEALFERDFTPGKHWDINSASVREVDDDEGDCGELAGKVFICKKQAVWDHKDIYSVAAAKTTIKILLVEREIHLNDYSYYVAG